MIFFIVVGDQENVNKPSDAFALNNEGIINYNTSNGFVLLDIDLDEYLIIS